MDISAVLEQALHACNGSQAELARTLRVSDSTAGFDHGLDDPLPLRQHIWFLAEMVAGVEPAHMTVTGMGLSDTNHVPGLRWDVSASTEPAWETFTLEAHLVFERHGRYVYELRADGRLVTQLQLVVGPPNPEGARLIELGPLES